jgi:type IV secretory pathway VirB6-like protein
MTKHCAQLKQAALQIPLAGIYSNGNFGCRSLLQQNTAQTIKTQPKNTFVNSIQILYFVSYFLISKKGSSLCEEDLIQSRLDLFRSNRHNIAVLHP